MLFCRYHSGLEVLYNAKIKHHFDLYFGPIPNELHELSLVEEALIARRRAKTRIIHLQDNVSHHRTHLFIHASYCSKSPQGSRHSISCSTRRPIQ
ncbi:uncharacterized protein EI90DRAFT_3105969 [Cantharellus anzutake]|uniref:uncharacterized protein n=1 Tax=Cantharellus anzutake TaxID=1750568 RepID=UPI0019089E2F|nr:uncharacterized protein EI90DRAFT_3105969 [Cantharellus anzutake]KAF8309180.1 hypothetical protein EI90DRAFT_3105969 [Cantharellus anzutake]